MKSQIINPETGRAVPNQFVISTKGGLYFKSYSTVVAFVPFNEERMVQLDRKYWNYSATTSKYLCIFLGKSNTHINNKVKLKLYKLCNLNGKKNRV